MQVLDKGMIHAYTLGWSGTVQDVIIAIEHSIQLKIYE